MKKVKIFVLFFLELIFGALIFFYISAEKIYDYQDSITLQTLPEVDAIVCLGGGRGRIDLASEIWSHYWEIKKNLDPAQKLPILYFSGMGSTVNWNLLSKKIRKEIILKMDLNSIIIEKESSNTEENAQWLAKSIKNHKWEKLILLTSGYHMKRAQFIFKKVFESLQIPLTIETYSVFQEPFTAKNWRKDPNGIRVTLIEYFKWIYYQTYWKPSLKKLLSEKESKY